MKLLNRAKAVDASGGYIISKSIKFEKGKMFLYSKPFSQWIECDESTRAINLPSDINNDKVKMFFSLREDGKGGDKVTYLDYREEYFLSCFKSDFGAYEKDQAYYTKVYINCPNLKVIGIQE